MPVTNPTAVPGTQSGWTNSGNVTASDGSYATATWSRVNEGGGVFEANPSPTLVLDTFGLAAGGQIAGIYVEMRGKGTNLGGVWEVQLTKSGAPVGNVKTVLVGSTDTTHSFGGAGDLWGAGWVVQDTSSIGVWVDATPSAGSGGGTVSIDYIYIAVWFDNPNAFTFTDVPVAVGATTYESNAVTISGLTYGSAQARANLGEWRKNGGSWSANDGFVVNGDSVQVRTTSSSSPGATNSVNFFVGTVSDTYSVTTQAADSTPDAFSLGSVTVEPSASAVSSVIAISGINTQAAFSVTNGLVSKNGGTFNLVSGTVNAGDTLQVLATASGTFGAEVDSVLTVGGVSDTFRVFTRAADTQPSQFTFTDVSGQLASTVITSNLVTVTGMDPGVNSPVTFPTLTGSPGAYQVSINGGAFVTATGTLNIQNGQTIQMRSTSNASSGGVVTMVVNIGGTTDSWTITTTTNDTTPDQFTFVDEPTAGASQLVTSAAITITGIDTAANVTFSSSNGSGAQYRKTVAGVYGVWTALAATTINPGEKIQVRITTDAGVGSSCSITMTVGGVSDVYNVTVIAPNSVPNDFLFVDVTGASFETTYSSNTVIVSGTNIPANISISGSGRYRVSSDGGATWTPWGSAAGTVNKADQVQVQVISAKVQQATVSTVLNIGGVSDSFDVTTRAPSPAQQYVLHFREVATWR